MIFRFTLTSPVYGSYILPSDPVGWEDTVMELSRDTELHGVLSEYSLDLKFFCGAGKEFIDSIFNEFGPDGEIGIIISYACGCEPGQDSPDYSIDYSDDYGSLSEGQCQYEIFYEGSINLSSYQSDRDYTVVTIEQSDIYAKFKNRLDTKVILTALDSLDGSAMNSYSFAPYKMTLHSKKIVFNSTWEANPPSNTVEISIGTVHAPPLDLITYDLPGSQSSFYDTTDPSSAIIQNLIGVEQSITISGTLNFTTFQKIQYISGSGATPVFTIGKGYFYYIDILDENFTLVSSVLINSETSVHTSTPVPVSFSFNETVVVPSLYFVRLRYDMNNIDFDPDYPPTYSGEYPLYVFLDLEYVYNESTNIQAVVESVVLNSQANVFCIHEALSIIGQYITDDSRPIISNYYGRKNSEPISYSENGCGSFRSITNGLQIRQFPIEKAPSISMKELYYSLDAIDNLGIGIEKVEDVYKIRIEPKAHFYDNSFSVQLENVSDIKRSVATEFYYNNITIGYDKWENEEINGIDEFNSKRQYSLGLKKIESTDEILSKLIASGYAIEFTRRKPFLTTATEDYKYDNEIFIVCLNRSVDSSGNPINLTIAEKNENFTGIANLISPETSYNLRLSPARNLLRRSNIVTPSILNYPGREIKLTYGEGNYSMQSEQIDDCPGSFNNALLGEGQNIIWDGDSNTDNIPLWIPEYFEFNYPLTLAQYKTVRDNPYKCIRFSSGNGEYINAFIIDLRYKVLSGMTEFKLLRAWE